MIPKFTDAWPSSSDIQLRYLLWHVNMLGNDIGTVMHRHCDFLFRVVYYTSTMWVRYCSDFKIIFENIFYNQFPSHSIVAYNVQQKPRFDICQNVQVIG